MFKVGDIVELIDDLFFDGILRLSSKQKGEITKKIDIDLFEIDFYACKFLINSKQIKLAESLSPPEPTISKVETVATDSTKFDIHRDICDTLNALCRAKNADYGDSFANTRKVVSNAILVRLNDKISRLNSLMSGNKQQVKDESIKDTLMDLANYAIMELVEMECENEK